MPSNDPFLVPSYDLHVRASDSDTAVTVTVASHHPLPIPVVGHRLVFDWSPAQLIVTDVAHAFGAHHRVRVYAEPVGELPCAPEELSAWLEQSPVIRPRML